MKEIIDKLNNLKISQKSLDFIEDLSEGLYEEYFRNHVIDGLNVDKHRWYETTLSVYKLEEGLLGVTSVTDLFSEQSTVNDIYHTLEFNEVEEIPSITYKIKK